MIRFILRFFGLLLFAAAFVLLIYDGTKSIASNRLALTSVRALWDNIHAGSLAALRPMIEDRAGAWIWELLFVPVLTAPSWAVLGVLGIVLLMLGRKKRTLIGYAR